MERNGTTLLFFLHKREEEICFKKLSMSFLELLRKFVLSYSKLSKVLQGLIQEVCVLTLNAEYNTPRHYDISVRYVPLMYMKVFIVQPLHNLFYSYVRCAYTDRTRWFYL
jgi:hypothetical protein